ncbi:hypothetical protein, partial [Lactococcus petauri]
MVSQYNPYIHKISLSLFSIVSQDLEKSLFLNNEANPFWSYTIKVDRKLCVIICLLRHKNERTFMSGFKRYDEEFKQSL